MTLTLTTNEHSGGEQLHHFQITKIWTLDIVARPPPLTNGSCFSWLPQNKSKRTNREVRISHDAPQGFREHSPHHEEGRGLHPTVPFWRGTRARHREPTAERICMR